MANLRQSNCARRTLGNSFDDQMKTSYCVNVIEFSRSCLQERLPVQHSSAILAEQLDSSHRAVAELPWWSFTRFFLRQSYIYRIDVHA